jgi:hypothetical protein
MGSFWQLPPQLLQPLEFLHCAPVQALRLGLVAEEQWNAVALTGQAEQAIGQHVVAVLGQGDFDAVGDVLMERKSGRTVGHSLRQAAEQAGFEARGAQHGLLAEGHLLEGEQFLGMDGVVDGNEVVAEADDFVDVFEPDDSEVWQRRGHVSRLFVRSGFYLNRW